MRVLGIDHGEVRIGLALSDPTRTLATPLCTYERRRKRLQDLRELTRRAHAEGAGEFVIGIPLEMSGVRGKKANEVQQFAMALRQESGLAVHEWDERLTTVQALASLHAAGAKRGRKAELVDSVAAAIILQSWLDAQPRRAEGELP
jgi:putative Holliday junction resolvase